MGTIVSYSVNLQSKGVPIVGAVEKGYIIENKLL